MPKLQSSISDARASLSQILAQVARGNGTVYELMPRRGAKAASALLVANFDTAAAGVPVKDFSALEAERNFTNLVEEVAAGQTVARITLLGQNPVYLVPPPIK